MRERRWGGKSGNKDGSKERRQQRRQCKNGSWLKEGYREEGNKVDDVIAKKEMREEVAKERIEERRWL